MPCHDHAAEISLPGLLPDLSAQYTRLSHEAGKKMFEDAVLAVQQ